MSDIILKRAASQISQDEFSQCSLNSTRGTSATPILSESLTDLESAASPITDTDVDVSNSYDGQSSLASTRGTSTTPILSSTDLESAAVSIAETVIDA